MMNMEQVARGTFRVEVLIPKVDTIFAVYIVREAEGILIEPGPTSTIPSIQEAMKQLRMKELAYIIPTHIHVDHAGAIGSLARLFPDAKVVLHPLGVKHVVNPSRLIESTKMAFGNDFEATYGPILPVHESQVEIPRDMEIVSIRGRELQIIYTPGHANHHISVLDRTTRGLFCGEALGLPLRGAESSPLPVAAPPSFDIDVYLQTMERLRGLSPRILFYSHDRVGRKPEELIAKAAENTKIFADIILKAVRKGETTEAIAQRVTQYIWSHLGVDGKELDTRMIVQGFISYFKKNELV